MLSSVAIFSGLTNWSLICFYCKPFSLWLPKDQAIFCLAGLWVIMFIQWSLKFFVSDVAKSDKLLNRRHQWQRQMLTQHLSSENGPNIFKTKSITASGFEGPDGCSDRP